MAATKILVFSAAVRGFHENKEPVCLPEATSCLTCLQSEHVVRIVKRQLVIYRQRFAGQQNTS